MSVAGHRFCGIRIAINRAGPRGDTNTARSVLQSYFRVGLVCGSRLRTSDRMLDGLEATTHHVAIEPLRETAPKTTVHADRRFVDNGRIVCSAGMAARIDMSLHVVGRLLGHEVAEKTARHMEYPWEPHFRGQPQGGS